MENKVKDLERLQEIQKKNISILDISIETRCDMQLTQVLATNYPYSKKYFVEKFPWGDDNEDLFREFDNKIADLIKTNNKTNVD